MSIGNAQDRFEQIRDESPKDAVLRMMPHLKLKKKINKWYILYEEKETVPFVKPNTNYNLLWLDAYAKCMENLSDGK